MNKSKLLLILLIVLFSFPGCEAENRSETEDDDKDSGTMDASADYDASTDTDTDTDSDSDSDTDFEAPKTCEEAIESRSNIGCEYWAADLDNAENRLGTDNAAGGQFAVAVANIGDNGTASVEVHINTADPGEALDLQLVEETDIAEGDLYIFNLPRRDVDGENVTKHIDDGPQTWYSSRAFRITSSIPVVAYQFNPINQMFSNDASLLLPTSGIGKDHLILGYPPSGPFEYMIGGKLEGPRNHGYITVLGVEEDTLVKITPTFEIMAGEGIDKIEKGTTAEFTIGPFDVLNLETKFVKYTELFGGLPDLSGSVVRADKPVVVFFGTDLSVVSNGDKFEDSCCAEHLEQQILPSEAMGKKFVVTHSAPRDPASPEEDFYRIMAYLDGTQVTTNLAPPNDSFTLDRGKFKQFFINKGFVVESTGPLHIAQLLVSQGDTQAMIGDSSLLYVPAVDQRRGLYVFATGKNFSRNHAVISMEKGTKAMIDGNDVATTCAGPTEDGELDGTVYESYVCDIEEGVHEVHSGDSPENANKPIAVMSYGYYSAGSYAYPAGSDLREINDDVIVE